MTVLRHRLSTRHLSPLYEEEDMGYRSCRLLNPNLRLSPNSFIMTISAVVFLYFVASFIQKPMPTPLLLQDEESRKGEFIAERALNHVKNLTNLGPRPVGSFANEVLAVNYLLKEVDLIVKKASRIHRINIDLQKCSGIFPLKFLDGMTSIYRNVQNVVVKIGPPVYSPHSILVNCHYDSVADSPGGSDDGASCAIMLEILRIISQSDTTLRNNIVFLFNGAEENLLQGSHGFITQHKWAKEIIAVVNMDACGAGGKELLFQVGPENPWLLEAYLNSVKIPTATSVAQEVFQSGIIPGDTDYRIFRDFGNVPGLDFAWATNGYVYHTKLDDADHVPLDTLQHTGENILPLVIYLANVHYPQDCPKTGNFVFFDVFGYFVMAVPEGTACLIGIGLIIISLFIIYNNGITTNRQLGLSLKNYLTHTLLSCILVVASLIGAVLSSVCIAFFLTCLNRTMSWYSRPVWIYCIYAIPPILVPIAMTAYMAHWQIRTLAVNTRWTLLRIHVDAYQLLLTVVLFLCICFRILSGFFPAIFLASLISANVLKDMSFSYLKGQYWTWLYIGAMLFPYMIGSYNIYFTFRIIVPIMGRSGAGNYTELIFAAITSFVYSILVQFVVPMITMVADYKKVTKVLSGILICSVLTLLLTPLGFPYSSSLTNPSPQRYVILTEHNFKGRITSERSGYWVVDMDVNSPHYVKSFVPELAEIEPITDCEKRLYCGLPYLLPVSTLMWKTHWIPAPKPNIFIQSNLTLIRREFKPHNIIRLNFNATGPDHMSLMMSPKEGVRLIGWSLTSDPPLLGPKWGSRDTYFLYYSCASNPEPWNFSIDLLVADTKYDESNEGEILDVALSGHFLHGAHQRSVRLKKLLSQFPPWTVTSGWTASLSSYIF